MMRWTMVTGLAVMALATAMPAFGQQPRATQPSASPADCARTPAKVDGQVVRVDPATNKVTIRDKNGTTHEFQSSRETVQTMKPGDRVEATLRQAPPQC
jgi:hypothetical protein